MYNNINTPRSHPMNVPAQNIFQPANLYNPYNYYITTRFPPPQRMRCYPNPNQFCSNYCPYYIGPYYAPVITYREINNSGNHYMGWQNAERNSGGHMRTNRGPFFRTNAVEANNYSSIYTNSVSSSSPAYGNEQAFTTHISRSTVTDNVITTSTSTDNVITTNILTDIITTSTLTDNTVTTSTLSAEAKPFVAFTPRNTNRGTHNGDSVGSSAVEPSEEINQPKTSKPSSLSVNAKPFTNHVLTVSSRSSRETTLTVSDCNTLLSVNAEPFMFCTTTSNTTHTFKTKKLSPEAQPFALRTSAYGETDTVVADNNYVSPPISPTVNRSATSSCNSTPLSVNAKPFTSSTPASHVTNTNGSTYSVDTGLTVKLSTLYSENNESIPSNCSLSIAAEPFVPNTVTSNIENTVIIRSELSVDAEPFTLPTSTCNEIKIVDSKSVINIGTGFCGNGAIETHNCCSLSVESSTSRDVLVDVKPFSLPMSTYDDDTNTHGANDINESSNILPNNVLLPVSSSNEVSNDRHNVVSVISKQFQLSTTAVLGAHAIANNNHNEGDTIPFSHPTATCCNEMGVTETIPSVPTTVFPAINEFESTVNAEPFLPFGPQHDENNVIDSYISLVNGEGLQNAAENNEIENCSCDIERNVSSNQFSLLGTHNNEIQLNGVIGEFPENSEFQTHNCRVELVSSFVPQHDANGVIEMGNGDIPLDNDEEFTNNMAVVSENEELGTNRQSTLSVDAEPYILSVSTSCTTNVVTSEESVLSVNERSFSLPTSTNSDASVDVQEIEPTTNRTSILSVNAKPFTLNSNSVTNQCSNDTNACTFAKSTSSFAMNEYANSTLSANAEPFVMSTNTRNNTNDIVSNNVFSTSGETSNNYILPRNLESNNSPPNVVQSNYIPSRAGESFLNAIALYASSDESIITRSLNTEPNVPSGTTSHIINVIIPCRLYVEPQFYGPYQM